MRKLLMFVVTVACLGLTGCARHHQPTPEERSMAMQKNWVYPTEYQTTIKNYWHGRLIDPTSPLFEFSTPRKGYFASGALREKSITWGWIVDYTINAKNRMGGYTGWKAHRTFIVNEQVICDTGTSIVCNMEAIE